MLNVERWNIQVWYYSLWIFFFFILTSYLLGLVGYILAQEKADARDTRPMSEEVLEMLEGHLKVRPRPFPTCCFAPCCCRNGIDRPCPL